MRKVYKIGIKKKKEKISLFGIDDIGASVPKNLSTLIFSENEELHIEGFRCISEYTQDVISINLKKGVITVIGEKLCIDMLSEDEICVCGKITGVEFC